MMQIFFGLIGQKEGVAVSEMREGFGKNRCVWSGSGYQESGLGYVELKCLLAPHMEMSRGSLDIKW